MRTSCLCCQGYIILAVIKWCCLCRPLGPQFLSMAAQNWEDKKAVCERTAQRLLLDIKAGMTIQLAGQQPSDDGNLFSPDLVSSCSIAFFIGTEKGRLILRKAGDTYLSKCSLSSCELQALQAAAKAEHLEVTQGLLHVGGPFVLTVQLMR